MHEFKAFGEHIVDGADAWDIEFSCDIVCDNALIDGILGRGCMQFEAKADIDGFESAAFAVIDQGRGARRQYDFFGRIIDEQRGSALSNQGKALGFCNAETCAGAAN